MALTDRGPYRRPQIKAYVAQMSRENPRVLRDNFVAELLIEQGFEIDECPRSIYDPQQLYTALERYAADWSQFERSDDHVKFGFRMAYKIFAKPSDARPLRALISDDQVARASKLNKSAGLPSLKKKRDDLVYALDRERQVLRGAKAPSPCVAYKRTQKNNKTRLVWGYPFEMTLMESRFARPLIDMFKNRRTTMALGWSKATLGAHVYGRVVEKKGRIVALDYSKFDSTISALFIRRSFDILSTWFSEEDRDAYGWDTIVNYFITTPIVMPDGHLYVGKTHGVPSGSYFTQMIDSIVNTAIVFAIVSKFKLKLNWKSLFVLGDDVLMNVKGDVDLDAWADYVSQFGLKINTDKTVLDDPHFLGASWRKGKPDASLRELAAKAVHPESFRNYQGKLDTGPKAVLRSYASNYVSAFRFIEQPDLLHYRRDLPPLEGWKPEWMTGSDRFHAEELSRKRIGNGGSGISSSLSARLLM